MSVGVDGGPAIVLDKVNKWYGSLHVLRDVCLTVAAQERVVVCGPSGSGKSTMIRCINRLEAHQEGRIIVDGTELTDDLRALDTIRREVGMVFQSFNLFPHLTILENCTLAPMRVRKMPRREAEALAMGYLERVRIPEQAEIGRAHAGATVGRAAAAGGDRAGAVHEAADHAVRRADQRAGPGDDQGGAGYDHRPGGRWHDDGVRDARDGVCPAGGAPGGVHGPGGGGGERDAGGGV
jgi:hypothetical protein